MFTRLRVGTVAVFLGVASILSITLHGWQARPIALAPGDALEWRPIGPFRAGPITAVTGDPSRIGVFYAGATGAGLWKTTDFGAHWRPLFGAPPAGTITAIAVAASEPDVVYAATAPLPSTLGAGSALHRSTDAGATWSPVGLVTRQRLSHVVVDPSNARRLFVAVQATTPRDGTHGIFRSADGGVTFERVLRTSGDDVGTPVFVHPGQPSRMLAVGLPNDASTNAAPGVLWSPDGGTSWQPTRGLPAIDARNVQMDVAAGGTDDSLLLLIASTTDAVIYRSTDYGASWTTSNANVPIDIRARARPRIALAQDGTLLVASGVLLESRDGGRTFTRRSLPPGDDVTTVWAHPSVAGVRLVAGARGAIVTVNAGETWSAGDALPSAIVDRVSVDTAFPYRVCATGGMAVTCAPGRGDNQADTSDWQRLPIDLTGPIVSDPSDADIVFGGAGLRHDRRTGQTLNVEPSAIPGGAPAPAVPMAFSADGRTLYAGASAVWRTINGGLAWTAVSPDLATSPARISALTVSPIDARTIWAGLDDGRVFVTRNGGLEWTEAQRPTGGPHVSVRGIEPSRFDTSSVYVVIASTDAAVSADAPRLLRTRDSGVTWTNVGAHMPDVNAVHAIREDPFRRGLLFAGTDRSVFVSFDDGEAWQPLALNLPPTPVRDLVIKDADLIAATAGRGVWVLDDISALRQVTADVLRADLFLFRPAQAWRVRASGAPLTSAAGSADAAAHGAMLTYVLGQAAQDEVTLEVIETTTGDVIRRFSSRPLAGSGAAAPATLSTAAGMHRVVWDLRYPPPVPGVAEASPGTVIVPGTYQVRLTVDGRSVRQAVTIRMDPRIRTSMVDLTAQRDLGRAIDAARAAGNPPRADTTAPAPVGAAGGRRAGLADIAGELDRLARVLQQADVRPAPRLEAAIEGALARASMALGTDTR